VQTTVTVVGGPGIGNRVLALNGRHQANDSPAMAFIHRRIGLLPAVLHEHPSRALVVGLGGGATAGGLSQFPGLTIDVVELSEGVVAAAAFFSHMNFDVLRAPHVRVRVDDGRNVLVRTRQPYDVITADAIPPNLAGANNVNSVEYFRLVRRALAPDGVALHWNGGGSGTAHKAILAAFVEVFPNATLWGDGTLMVGSAEPMTLSEGRINALLSTEAGRHALSLMNVERFDHLVRMFRASPADIRAYLAGAAPLTDDRPIIEYEASFPQEPLNLQAIGRDATGLVR
jgi:spermidine synthase